MSKLLDPFLAPSPDLLHTPKGEQSDATDPLVDRWLDPLVVRGEAAFMQRPSLAHGLTPRDLHASTTLRGRCWQLEPLSGPEDGAELVTTTRKGVVYELWVRRAPLRTKEEAFRAFASMSEDELQAQVLRHNAASAEDLLERSPHEGRGDMLIGDRVLYRSAWSHLNELSPDAVLAAHDGLVAAVQAVQRGGDPMEEDLATFDQLLRADLRHGALLEELGLLLDTFRLREEVLGVAEDGEFRRPFDVEPAEPLNWGLPEGLVEPMSSPGAYKRWLAWTGGWSRGRINDAASVRDFLTFNKANAGLEVPSYRELSQAMVRQQAAFQERWDAWDARRDPTSAWANLGTVVSSLTTWSEETGVYQGPHGSYEARPRPGLASEPAHLTDAAGEYVRDQLTGGATPEDEVVFMGELTPLAADLPASFDGVRAWGHPMADQIRQLMEALSSPRDPLSLGLLTYGEAVENTTLILPRGVKIYEREWCGRTYPSVLLGGVEEKPLRALLHKGTGRRFGRTGQTVRATILWDFPLGGYVHRLKAFNRQTGSWFLVNPKDPVLKAYEDLLNEGRLEEVPDRLHFLSRAEFLAFRLPFVAVPTLELRGDGYEEPLLPAVVWKDCASLFPALCRWFSAAAEAFNDGEEGVTGFYDGEEDLIQSVWEELRQVQRRASDTLLRANLRLVEPALDLMAEIRHALVHDPDSLRRPIWGEEGEDGQTAYGHAFGRGTGLVWQVLKRIQGANSLLVVPREAESSRTLFWRAFGYLPASTDRPKGIRFAQRMVEERIYRSSSQTERVWWVDGAPKPMPPLHPHGASMANFATGLLGTDIAQTMSALFEVSLPSFRGSIFVPSAEAYEKAQGNWRVAQLFHLKGIFPNHVWGSDVLLRLWRLVGAWGSRRDLNGKANQEEAFDLFLKELFPVPQSGAWRMLEERTDDGFAVGPLASAKSRFLLAAEKAFFNRLLILSPRPGGTKDLYRASRSMAALESYGPAKAIGVLQNHQDLLGPVGGIVQSNIRALFAKAAVEEAPLKS